jgi:hypothetical protein
MNIFKRVFEYFRLRRDWILVHHTDCDVVDSKDRLECTIHYHLYENGVGKRKMKTQFTGPKSEYSKYVKRAHIYITCISVWLDGQKVKGIDSYQQAKHQQMMDELSGK